MDNMLQLMAIITNEYPSESWSGMAATVIVGISVVFLILLILIGFLYLLGFIMHGGSKKKEEKKPASAPVTVQPAAPANNAAADVETEDEEDDEEIIAVISAAIAAYSEQDGKTYTIKKIKKSDKQPRSAWGNAGVVNNTRPF